MDRKLIRDIESYFPYPVASCVRVLNTEEFIEPGNKRLEQILKIAEITIQFIGIIVTVDLFENYLNNKLSVSPGFKKEFGGRFTRTTFGKWIALTRDALKIFKEDNVPMFMTELPDFFISGKSSETEAQKAFNSLTTLRNSIAHLNANPSRKDFENLCEQAEISLELILKQLFFLEKYLFLYVGQVSVKHFRWMKPDYQHSFSEVIGHASQFNAYKKVFNDLINAPAIIIAKENEGNYLNLDPLIIYSDEGEKKIYDVFMYTDIEFGKKAVYRPVWNGGNFNLYETSIEKNASLAIAKIFESFKP